MIYLEPGDIVFCKGASWLSKAIRVCTRSKKEPKTKTNHVAIVVTYGAIRIAKIVEALHKVESLNLRRYDDGKTEIAIYRNIRLELIDQDCIRSVARGYVGQKYGYHKLIPHFLDWLIGGRYFFRRILFLQDYPICSWVVSYSLFKCGIEISDLPPSAQSPDDMLDSIENHPDWHCVYGWGKL